MTSRREEQVEMAIWKELASESLSVSHDHWHIGRVLSFAHELQSTYGGDPEIITAAAILHDWGRSDPSLHGEDSIEESISRARRLLGRVGFPSDKIEEVITAINDHDKPDVTPSTIEGRILKDADFLGGFGAWGILRIAMWAGETGGGVGQIFDRLENRMPTRLANLEFPESERLATEETVFANLFLSLLRQPPELSTNSRKGAYIVLEGISGAGKDCQADILKERLEACDLSVVKVNEPGHLYRELRDVCQAEQKSQLRDPTLMQFLLMADRYWQVQTEVWPALRRGDVVISVRSFVSLLVYQCSDACDVAAAAFGHRFVPLPDLFLLLDVDADVAWARIRDRENKGIYETKDLLGRHRVLYRDISDRLFKRQLKVIDASRTIAEVAEQAWKATESVL